MLESSRVAAQLAAYQEGLSSMKLVWLVDQIGVLIKSFPYARRYSSPAVVYVHVIAMRM
jgi:hypothetical protein